MNPSSLIPVVGAQNTSNAADTSQFGNYSDWAQGEIAKGFTPDQLHQTLSQNGIQLPQAQQAAPAATQQPQGGGGSWWEKLIPAAGGVVGGLAGGLLGGVGAIGGAGVGAAAGQALENKLEGKSAIQANDLTSGVENGLGEAVGLGAGKVVGALGEGIVKAGTRAGEKGAADVASKAAIGNAVNEAELTKLNYGGISPKLASDLELGKQQQFVKSMGFDHTNPYDMEKVGLGVNDLNNVYERALSTAQPVKMNDAGQLFGATQASPDALTQAEQAALQKQGVTPQLSAKGTVTGVQPNGAPGVYQGVDPNSRVGLALADFNQQAGKAPLTELPTEMSATDVRKLQQAVGRQIGNSHTVINNAELNGVTNTEEQATLGKLQDMYGKLGDRIKTGEVNSNIQGFKVTDADRQGLVAKYGDKLGTHLADTIDNAKTADDLLGPMQDLTKASRASRMAINDIENVTNSPRAVARAKFQQNGGVAPSKASTTGSNAGDVIEAAAHLVHKPTGLVVSAGKRLHEAGMTPAIAKGVGNVMKRTASLLPAASVVNSNIPNIADGSQGGGSMVPSTQEGGAMQPTASVQPGGAVNPENSALSSILWSLGQPGASLTPGYGSMVSGAQSLAPQVQQNALAANTASTLMPTFNNAGGAQGMGGGLLSSLLSHVPGTAQNTYTREQQATAEQLAKVLGISPAAALSMLPQFMQTPQSAAPQVGATQGLVGQLTAGLPTQ